MKTVSPVQPPPLLPLETARIKATLAARFPHLRGSHPDLLQLALNEAEALAWATSLPRLVFPALAEEKLETLQGWVQRQEALCEATRPSSLAA